MNCNCETGCPKCRPEAFERVHANRIPFDEIGGIASPLKDIRRELSDGPFGEPDPQTIHGNTESADELSEMTDAEINAEVARRVMGWKDMSKGRPAMVGGFWDDTARRTRLILGSPISLQRVKLLKRPESEENADFVFDPLHDANDRDEMLARFPGKAVFLEIHGVSVWCTIQDGDGTLFESGIHSTHGRAACCAALMARPAKCPGT